MQDEYKNLTGTSPDDASDIGIRLKVLALQLQELYEYADMQYQQIFPQTASGEYLDMHAQLRGLTRKAAACSSGTLIFSRSQEEEFETEVPKGTLCALKDDPSIMFETTEKAVIGTGEISVSVPALSCSGGINTNVKADMVTLMITPPTGVFSVSNSLPFTGGEDAEDDETLRKRVIDSMSSISNGANAAFYRDAAMKHDEITSCSVVPRARGRGTVDVILASGGHAPEEELLNAVSDDIDKCREIGTDLLVLGVTPVEKNVNITVKMNDGYDEEETEEECRKAVYGFFEKLEIGEKLNVSALLSSVYGVKAVKSAEIKQPAGDAEAEYDELFIPGTVTVEAEK